MEQPPEGREYFLKKREEVLRKIAEEEDILKSYKQTLANLDSHLRTTKINIDSVKKTIEVSDEPAKELKEQDADFKINKEKYINTRQDNREPTFICQPDVGTPQTNEMEQMHYDRLAKRPEQFNVYNYSSKYAPAVQERVLEEAEKAHRAREIQEQRRYLQQEQAEQQYYQQQQTSPPPYPTSPPYPTPPPDYSRDYTGFNNGFQQSQPQYAPPFGRQQQYVGRGNNILDLVKDNIRIIGLTVAGLVFLYFFMFAK